MKILKYSCGLVATFLTMVAFGQPLFHITDSMYLDLDVTKHPYYDGLENDYPLYNDARNSQLFSDIIWQQQNRKTVNFLYQQLKDKPDGYVSHWGILHTIPDSLMYSDSLGFNDGRISFIGDWTFGANCHCAFAKPGAKLIYEHDGVIEVYGENDPAHGAILINGDTIVLNGPHKDGVFLGAYDDRINIEILDWPVGWDYFAFEYIKIYEHESKSDLPKWVMWMIVGIAILVVVLIYVFKKDT